MKLPTTAQLEANISREAAREDEKWFFESSGTPWTRLSMRSDNVGVERLVTSLSRTLSALIAER